MIFFVSAIFVLLTINIVTLCSCTLTGTCNTQTGPACTQECVLINEYPMSPGVPYYTDYQWATCLSNAYIKAISGGRYYCIDTSATYCWFQCMLEINNSLGPGVYGDCLCRNSPNSAKNNSLPAECCTPDGTNCDWYANCLEARYPCKGTSSGYAVEYATKFCKLYGENSEMFSATGQRWIAAVRKCLQVNLVPLLRPHVTATCADIKSKAFSSHTGCYLHPYAGAPSMCDLPLSDYWRIMHTIKDAFINPSTAGETICSGLEVLKGCFVNHKATDICMRAFVADLHLFYSKMFSYFENLAQLSADIVDQISSRLQWPSRNLKVLGCRVDSVASKEGMRVNAIIGVPDLNDCLRSLESSAGKRSTSSVDLDAVVAEFEKAVSNGSLLLYVKKFPIYVAALGTCDPLTCSNTTTLNTTAPPPPSPPPPPPTSAAALNHWKFTTVLSALPVIHTLRFLCYFYLA